MRYVLLALVLGCAAKSPDSTSTACQRALAGLRADHDAGVACEAAKARALIAEPGCPLTFSCPDGGR